MGTEMNYLLNELPILNNLGALPCETWKFKHPMFQLLYQSLMCSTLMIDNFVTGIPMHEAHNGRIM